MNTKLLKPHKVQKNAGSLGQGRPDGPSVVLREPVGVAVSLQAETWSPTLALSTTQFSGPVAFLDLLL